MERDDCFQLAGEGSPFSLLILNTSSTTDQRLDLNLLASFPVKEDSGNPTPGKVVCRLAQSVKQAVFAHGEKNRKRDYKILIFPE